MLDVFKPTDEQCARMSAKVHPPHAQGTGKILWRWQPLWHALESEKQLVQPGDYKAWKLATIETTPVEGVISQLLAFLPEVTALELEWYRFEFERAADTCGVSIRDMHPPTDMVSLVVRMHRHVSLTLRLRLLPRHSLKRSLGDFDRASQAELYNGFGRWIYSEEKQKPNMDIVVARRNERDSAFMQHVDETLFSKSPDEIVVCAFTFFLKYGKAQKTWVSRTQLVESMVRVMPGKFPTEESVIRAIESACSRNFMWQRLHKPCSNKGYWILLPQK